MAMKLSLFIIGALLAVALGACGQLTASSGGTSGHDGHTAGHAHDPAQASPGAATTGMEHGPSASATSDAPLDARFIDSMIEHHQGAITMAEQALKESQRPELKQLAQNIITVQRQEIEQMTAWRKQWYPNLPPTGGMGMHMGHMEVPADSNKSFDQRFIEGMIPHHNDAIDMARAIQTQVEHPELKQLAGAIIQAQEAEVKQLQQWKQQWFGQ